MVEPSITVVLDCADADALAPFWSAVLGYDSGHRVTQFVVLNPPPSDPRPPLILQQVPEPKVVKNRSHMDLHVADVEATRARLLALGATMVDPNKRCIGDHCWYVMADPEGNEFCLAPE
jgi:predicted enzyme related to lactoylglutathione lyase